MEKCAVRAVRRGSSSPKTVALMVFLQPMPAEQFQNGRDVGSADLRPRERQCFFRHLADLYLGPGDQIANWRPISTTISLGRLKYSIASLELCNRKENMPSTSRGSPLPSSRRTIDSRPMK